MAYECRVRPLAPKCNNCKCQWYTFDHIMHTCKTCNNSWWDDGKDTKK